LKKYPWIAGLVALAALAALVIWGRNKVQFNFAVFRAQLNHADWSKIGIAVAAIYLGYIVRAARWARLLKHNKKVPPLSLVGTQVIGFTAVALIGRVADLTRPFLISKKTGLPLGSQFAVYVVERLLDAGTIGLLLSAAILITPPGTLPHPEVIEKTKYWFLTFTILGTIFCFAVRLAGDMVASFLGRAFGLISKKLGHAVGSKIRIFHAGLDTMRTWSDFGSIAGLSLLLWFLILFAYFETERAFVDSPILASMTLAKSMLILAFSGGASFIQLPVLGWFTQIGIVGEAIHDFFGVAREPAWACSAMLLLGTFLSVLPLGLVWAQMEHVSLRKVTVESEHAGEKLAIEETTKPLA
jgi:hypothetical protein